MSARPLDHYELSPAEKPRTYVITAAGRRALQETGA
jgi:hypothetical protein